MDEYTGYGEIMTSVLAELCRPDSYRGVIHRSNHDVPMPSTESLREVVELTRAILFPGYFGFPHLTIANMASYVGYAMDRLAHLMEKQIRRGFCFACADEVQVCSDCNTRARDLTAEFLGRLPAVRALLSTDVRAAYEGDPAAKNPGETIFCYPSIRTLTNYRMAHELHSMGVPLIPRIITELAHAETGVDIHPGATIGEEFFMDHCTGIVIGETTVIGRRVRIYQGVTLGAKSFPLDEQGNPIKGIARHPVVEDEVIIYSGATILGRVIIGAGSVIGGNVWLTQDVPRGSRVLQGTPQRTRFSDGGGI